MIAVAALRQPGAKQRPIRVGRGERLEVRARTDDCSGRRHAGDSGLRHRERSALMRQPFLVVSLTTVIAHGSEAQRLAKPVIDTVNRHIVRVMNGGPTAWSDTNGWKLVYERTVQPPEASPGMLEKPTQVLLLRDGRLVVSQRNPALVRLYDAQGKFIRDIGREGEGPGEYRAPRLALYRDTIVVHDSRLGRAALIAPDGKFVRQFVTNVHYDGPPISVDDRGRMQVSTSRAAGAAFQSQWVYFDLNGRRLDSLVPPEVAKARNWQANIANGVMRQSVPFSPFDFYQFLHDGSVDTAALIAISSSLPATGATPCACSVAPTSAPSRFRRRCAIRSSRRSPETKTSGGSQPRATSRAPMPSGVGCRSTRTATPGSCRVARPGRRRSGSTCSTRRAGFSARCRRPSPLFVRVLVGRSYRGARPRQGRTAAGPHLRIDRRGH